MITLQQQQQTRQSVSDSIQPRPCLTSSCWACLSSGALCRNSDIYAHLQGAQIYQKTTDRRHH